MIHGAVFLFRRYRKRKKGVMLMLRLCAVCVVLMLAGCSLTTDDPARRLGELQHPKRGYAGAHRAEYRDDRRGLDAGQLTGRRELYLCQPGIPPPATAEAIEEAATQEATVEATQEATEDAATQEPLPEATEETLGEE